MEKISVAVRVRPPATQQTSDGSHWKVEANRISLHKTLGTPISGISYAFDHVFDQECTNARVYELLTKDVIHAAIDGFNGTAFAYGQTSSGKTFTMNGSQDDPGIIRRAVEDIFRKIEMTTDREFLIRVSYMEIYNEEINDLLTIENQRLQIHESLERGIFVAGLREEIVNNVEQVLKLIQSGEVNRHFGETNMNVRSSRSHTIFRMVIESKGKDAFSDDAIRVSVLNLVDLAGSERIAKTGAGGVRLKEGKHINKSLMILGNVINKLSEGAKQRGHIPYRDSKLTRILQPALGGNAKTSIICTVAPEEDHIEESKGTLQFASRAKRITNCVQVNEILTDAALLKRQKLEIEELREKLQGSRAEVLEQEVLKLRNDMLKYELEHEKLAMELEEERRSQKEREHCIREQQMKINNLNSRVTSADSNKTSSQDQDFVRQNLKEESIGSRNTCPEDDFRTPCFKSVSNSFVAKRSFHSKQPDYSPLPEAFNKVADEDTWMKMNKGFIADLDSLQMTPAATPAVKFKYSPSRDLIPACSIQDYREEVENLRRQLELTTKEKEELERSNMEQVQLNQRLMEKISELQQEALLIQKLPQKLHESVVDCKDAYKDVLSNLQSIFVDEKSETAKLVSSLDEIGTDLFSTLETQLSTAMEGCKTSSSRKKSLIQGKCKSPREKLTGPITSLLFPEAPNMEDKHLGRSPLYKWKYKARRFGGELASWKEKLDNELKMINEESLKLKKQLYNEQEESSQREALFSEQKKKLLEDLEREAKRRQTVEEEMKKFNVEFANRQQSFKSFQDEFQSTLQRLKKAHQQNQLLLSKSYGF